MTKSQARALVDALRAYIDRTIAVSIATQTSKDPEVIKKAKETQQVSWENLDRVVDAMQ